MRRTRATGVLDLVNHQPVVALAQRDQHVWTLAQERHREHKQVLERDRVGSAHLELELLPHRGDQPGRWVPRVPLVGAPGLKPVLCSRDPVLDLGRSARCSERASSPVCARTAA
jgi:hypothetical protein